MLEVSRIHKFHYSLCSGLNMSELKGEQFYTETKQERTNKGSKMNVE